MEATHLLVARQARLENIIERLLAGIEDAHPDTWSLKLVKAVEAAREALDD